MTAPAPRTAAADESNVRRAGRQLILSAYGALRAVKLYPVENVAVQKALAEVTAHARDMAKNEGDLELRISGEFLFVNQVRLRLELDNFASFSHLLSLFRACGIGTLHIAPTVSEKDWLIFFSLMQAPATDNPEERLEQLQSKLAGAGVSTLTMAPPTEQGDHQEKAKERARRTYDQSVAATKELMGSLRMGATANLKKIKRLVQSIVDQILTEETSLIGMTTLRDYDEYTFTHSVNVCIFSVALGRRLGLSKVQLYDLGMAALFHDIGKSRVPNEIINKTDRLNEDEWRIVANHPWFGVLALFSVRGAQELPYRAMIVAYEHHMKADLSGYPRPLRNRQMGVFSKIVAVADGFDAATTRRSYQPVPYSPADVMKELLENRRRGMDPVVVKAFINLTGVYPVGTFVVLDTFELGVVHAVNPLEDMISRPIVRIVSDAKGNVLFPGALADLADRNEKGDFVRTIIKTENPERYGIRIADYFV